MAQIRIKRSTGSSAPSSSDLANAELAFTEGNDILYYGEGTSGSNAASVIKIGGSGAFVDLTSAQSVAGNKTFSNNVVVSGNLTVNGTTTTLNTTNSVVKDALIELGNGTSGSPANDAGLVIERGSSDNAFIGWDESVNKFAIGTGTFTGASTGDLTLSTATLVGNLEGNVTGNCSGTSGGFTAGNASNLNSGTVPVARLSDGSITEAKLDIHNSPTNGYILKYTSNGLEWAAAGAGGENNQNAFSNIAVSGQNTVAADSSTDTVTYVAGSNVTITTDNSGDTVTFAATDTNTTYSVGDGGLTANNFTNALKSKLDSIEASATADQTDEEIQDVVGAMFSSNTETGITATYQDSDGTIDLVVGTLNQDTTGNAATATVLATARNIGGVSFNGSANINLPGVNSAGNQNTSGNAATATTLATARTIGGVSFDGSANINLPGVNTSGSQDTSGTAATATILETARTIAGVSFNGSANISLNNNAITNGAGYITSSGNSATSTTATNITASANNSTDETVYLAFVDGATGSQGIETDTGLAYNPSSGLLTVGVIDGGTW